MKRRFWRRYQRSRQDLDLRFFSTINLAACLEVDAANQLLDEASNFVGNDKRALLNLKLSRASIQRVNGQELEALELFMAIVSEAKAYTTSPHLYERTMHQIAIVLLDLHRYQEAHDAAAELVAFAKAKFGLEDPLTLNARSMYAEACAFLGRVEEAKATFEDVLAKETRILGHDHPRTQGTRDVMCSLGFAVPSG